jgi:hypothetical protein
MVATDSVFLSVGFSFDAKLPINLNPVKNGRVKRPEDWWRSSYNNFSLDKATVAAYPMQIDYVRMPVGYRA